MRDEGMINSICMRVGLCSSFYVVADCNGCNFLALPIF